MKAAMPPAFWAWAMTCRASVVLPLDSGPKISMIAAAGNALAAQGDVERQAAGGDALDRRGRVAAQGHDRPFAELLFDGGDGVAELGAVFQHAGRRGDFLPDLGSDLCPLSFLAMLFLGTELWDTALWDAALRDTVAVTMIRPLYPIV